METGNSVDKKNQRHLAHSDAFLSLEVVFLSGIEIRHLSLILRTTPIEWYSCYYTKKKSKYPKRKMVLDVFFSLKLAPVPNLVNYSYSLNPYLIPDFKENLMNFYLEAIIKSISVQVMLLIELWIHKFLFENHKQKCWICASYWAANP